MYVPQFTYLTAARDLGVTLDITFFLCLTAPIYPELASVIYAVYVQSDARRPCLLLFTSMVHAFVCFMVDYCNSLLIGLIKSRLDPLQSDLNAAACLIACI